MLALAGLSGRPCAPRQLSRGPQRQAAPARRRCVPSASAAPPPDDGSSSSSDMPMWRAYRLESELFGDASDEVAQAALVEQIQLLLPAAAAAPSTQLISDVSHLCEQLQDVLDSAVPLSAPSTHLSSSSNSNSDWSRLVQCSQLMLDSGLFSEASCKVIRALQERQRRFAAEEQAWIEATGVPLTAPAPAVAPLDAPAAGPVGPLEADSRPAEDEAPPTAAEAAAAGDDDLAAALQKAVAAARAAVEAAGEARAAAEVQAAELKLARAELKLARADAAVERAHLEEELAERDAEIARLARCIRLAVAWQRLHCPASR